LGNERINAFSDGVIAILITIMVLELRVPHTTDLDALRQLLPVFLTYVLSFIILGIYWSNHHHLMHITEQVSGSVLWANLHLLFWLSMIPFTTAWMSGHHDAPLPVAVYGGVLLCGSIAWQILKERIVRLEANARLREALGSDLKGKASLACYVAAVPLAFVWPPLSIGLYVLVALVWLAPDRRIESKV